MNLYPTDEHSKGHTRAITKGSKGERGKLAAWDRQDTSKPSARKG